MKNILCLITFISIFVFPTFLNAAALSLGTWQPNGYQMWRTAFPQNGASELYYPLSGRYITATYEKPITPMKQLHISIGTMSLSPGKGTDSDWDYTTNTDLMYFGEFKSTGRSSFANITLNNKVSANTTLNYGYGFHHTDFLMTNGFYQIENYNNVSHQLPNLNSGYNITYQGPTIGIDHSLPLSPQIRLLTGITYSPIALVQGEGWWNLRQLNFKQIGPGQIFSGTIGLKILTKKLPDASLFLGYQYTRLSLLHGTENTNPDIVWKQAENIQQGFLFSGQAHF